MTGITRWWVRRITESRLDRALYQFNTASLAGLTVTGATLSLQEIGSGSCIAGRG